jgi:hypothetical protein
MARNPAYWRRRWRERTPRDPALVAEDGGVIVGYAIGSWGGGVTSIQEVIWRPAFDGTDLGSRLVAELLRRIERRRPVSIAAFEMIGSPTLPLVRRALGRERPPGSVFMAGVVDARALLRDAARVLRRRRVRGVRLRIDGHQAEVGGRASTSISMEGSVLLGLLLGIRDFDVELRKHRVLVKPAGERGRETARAAFPLRRFQIKDEW